MAKHTLSKEERLKSRKSIDRLFEEGDSISQYPIRMVYLVQDLPKGEKSSLFSVSVPKRNFKRAVDRNRIKRLVREAFRLNCIDLRNQLDQDEKQIMLMMLYYGKDLPTYEQVSESVIKILAKYLKS